MYIYGKIVIMLKLTIEDCLPDDLNDAVLVGRAWVPGDIPGPSPIVVREGRIIDLSKSVSTVSELLNNNDPLQFIDSANGEDIGSLKDILSSSVYNSRNESFPYLLAPADLQAVKACGVTFAESMLERVIEERAKGDPVTADRIRDEIREMIGLNLSDIIPGSAEAMKLKSVLIEKKMWSQYLEVGIGPDAEIFTKAQPMSVVGFTPQ